MTVSLKFSVSSLADSGRNLVSGRSVFSDTDLYSNSNEKRNSINSLPTCVVC